jgi:hypothetical protein
MRACTLGASLCRESQFLRCAPQCFIRRFIVPLHRARSDFQLDDLREGRIDLAARLVTSTLVCSQRLRHNAQLWLPLLGDDEPTTVCVTGGLVRRLHPSELPTAERLRRALDELREGGAAAGTPPEQLDHDLRGFRLLRGGLQTALEEALRQARDLLPRQLLAATIL